MLVNRPLVLLALTVFAASTVHSQSANPGDSASPGPAPLFTDPSSASAPQSKSGAPTLSDVMAAIGGDSANRHPAGQSSGVQPFALNVPAPNASAGAGGPAGQAPIDLTALRYFASQNNLTRVAAEIRVIRAKHPDWEPPEDLLSDTKGTEQEGPLWDLFGKQDYQGVRDGIAKIQESAPDWQPSSDLLGKLTLAEANEKLVQASNDSDWGAVIDIAANNKMLLTCAYVDAMWRTAEALVRSDSEPRAIEAYRYILANCAKPEERLATAQKASQLIASGEDLDSLLQMGRRLPNGRSEFESVRLDTIRKKIGDAAAAGDAGTPPSQSEMDAIVSRARNASDKSDQQLLGWYAYSRKDFVQAETWFRMALSGSAPNPKAAEGLVLTLRAADKLADARKLAVQYAPLGPLNQKIMVETLTLLLDDPKADPLSGDEAAMLVKAIDTLQSADGAASYGWHVYKDNAIADAQTWFRKSAAWAQNESAAIGLVVSARRLNQIADYAQLVAKYRETYPKIAQFDDLMRTSYVASANLRGAPHRYASRGLGAGAGGVWDRNADAIVKELQAGNYAQTVAMIEARKQSGHAEPAGLLIVHGWALYHNGDWEGAKRVFAEAATKGHAEEADDGLSQIRHAELPPALR